jgi:hypothetical protein
MVDTSYASAHTRTAAFYFWRPARAEAWSRNALAILAVEQFVERTGVGQCNLGWLEICDWSVLEKLAWASGTGLRRRVHFQAAATDRAGSRWPRKAAAARTTWKDARGKAPVELVV